MLRGPLAHWIGILIMVATQARLPPATSSAHISGRVVDDRSFEPLSNARVFLYPIPFPEGSRATLAMTDQAGVFSFTAVRPGSYRLMTNKIGFFPTPGAGAPFITVSAVEDSLSVELTMSRGGALTGHIFDESGRPLKDIWVAALRLVGPSVDQAVPSTTTARTNERGEYAVESLQPGDYVVVANPGHGPIGADADGITDSRTYFPGTLDTAKARPVTVGSAQRVPGLDFKLMIAPTFAVSGIAVDDDGHAVAGALVSLDADWPKFGGAKGSCLTDSDGRFRISLISAGEYKLTALSPGLPPRPVTRQTPFVPIHVVDGDVSGLIVRMPIQ